MANDLLRLLALYLPFASRFVLSLAWSKALAAIHKWTWSSGPEPKNVVVVGGSFAGLVLVQRLTETLPSGYRVILVESNSHFNYLFAFPRFSVVPGYEETAFLPYDSMTRGAPKGIFQRYCHNAEHIKPGSLVLEDGTTLSYECLALATGTAQSLVGATQDTDKLQQCKAMQTRQKHIRMASSIAIIGGGAVGVQTAADIKDMYPEKIVMLVHSRSELLTGFGPCLGMHAKQALTELGVRVVLNQRPKYQFNPEGGKEGGLLTWDTKIEETFDLIVGISRQEYSA
jgi:apoptosis-inducing factor 2